MTWGYIIVAGFFGIVFAVAFVLIAQAQWRDR